MLNSQGIPFSQYRRDNTLTGHLCYDCGERLTHGEYESTGNCTACNWSFRDMAQAFEHEQKLTQGLEDL